MKVLVTGGCGFIGGHLCEKLVAQGHTVLATDHLHNCRGQDEQDPVESYNRKIEALGALKDLDGFSFHDCEMKDIPDLIAAWSPDVVCHLAALGGVRASIRDAQKYTEVNLCGTIRVMEACYVIGAPLVFASSSSVYGTNTKVPFCETDVVDSPNSPYACSKRACELFAQTFVRNHRDANIVALRFFTVYGPRGRRDMAPFKFLKGIFNGEPIAMYGDGSSSRDYTYIDDIVGGIIGSVRFICDEKNGGYHCFNLGSSRPVALTSFIQTCERVVGKKAKIVQCKQQDGDVLATYSDSSKAKAILGFGAETPLVDGLRNTFEWMQKF